MPQSPPADDAASPPGPPFSVDLIADLHAGVLPDEVADSLWPRVRADSDAMRVVAALDATQADLRAAPIVADPPPPHAITAIEASLAAVRADMDTQGAAAAPRVESIEDARDRIRDARRRRGMVIASIAAGIIAVVTLAVAVITTTQPSGGSEQRADPSPSVSGPAGSANLQVGALLSYIGRSEATFTGANDPARLQRCLRANGVTATTQVVGSGPITVDAGPAVVVLLSTGVAGRFDALVVGRGCDTGTPATISRRTLGAPQPTR